MTARRFEIFVIIVIIAVIGIIYAFKEDVTLSPQVANRDNNSQNISTDADEQKQVPATVITYQGQDGKTALEILKTTHQVEVKSYSFGDMVVSIDGIAPNPATHFWAMYVN